MPSSDGLAEQLSRRVEALSTPLTSNSPLLFVCSFPGTLSAKPLSSASPCDPHHTPIPARAEGLPLSNPLPSVYTTRW